MKLQIRQLKLTFLTVFVTIDVKYYIIKVLAENDKCKLVLNNRVFEMCDVISVNYCLFILLLIICCYSVNARRLIVHSHYFGFACIILIMTSATGNPRISDRKFQLSKSKLLQVVLT